MLVLAVGLVAGQLMLSFTSIVHGAMSGIAEPQQVVVRTADDWRRIWRAHASEESVPEVDFSSSMVIGVLLGTKPNPAYRVEITAIESLGDRTVVSFVERQPEAGTMVAQVIAAPFHFVRVTRRDGIVRFEQVDE